MAFFNRKLGHKYTISKAFMPKRDFIIEETGLKGVVVAVSPTNEGALLTYNACPPSPMLRMLAPVFNIIGVVMSKSIIEDVKLLVENTTDMSQE